MTDARVNQTGIVGLALWTAMGMAGCGEEAKSDGEGQTSIITASSSVSDGSAGPEDTDGSTGLDSASGPVSAGGATSGPLDGTTSGGGEPSPIKFDQGALPDAPDTVFCGAPDPVSCDTMDDDPWHAIGLNCPGGPQVAGSQQGDPMQFYVHQGNLGTYEPAPFPPREGEKMLVMSTGRANQIVEAGTFASTLVPGQDPGYNLPVPLQTNAVSNTETCTDNPGLVGTGDCSNTIEGQWNQGSGANDYAEMRFTVDVPANTFGFSYDFAMFSSEYPIWYQTSYNDMYVAWLESEQWTGNISFDEMGNPISLNAGFLDYKDDDNPYDCPAPCEAPELQGTAMETHAATKWLTTTAPVTPGETIEVVFAVFDLSDNYYDTVVIIDNYQWTCEGGPPITIPG